MLALPTVFLYMFRIFQNTNNCLEMYNEIMLKCLSQ